MLRVLVLATLVVVGCGAGSSDVNPDKSSVTVDLVTGVVANGADAVTLTVTLRNGDGAPVSGRDVAVSSVDDVTIGSIAPTDSSGETHILLTSTVAGPKTIDIAYEDLALATIVIEFAPGPVAGIAYLDPVGPGEIGRALPMFRVAFVDAFDNVITTETGMIAVAVLANNQGAGTSGDTVVATVDGVATFADVEVTAVATGLVMRATATSGAARDSDLFDVTFGAPSAATSTIVATPSSAPADGLTSIAILVTIRNAGGVAIPSQAVGLSASGSGKSFYPSATGMTNAQGQFESSVLSTDVGTSSVAATSGSATVSTSVQFTTPPCVPQLPNGPGALVADKAWTMVVADYSGDGHLDAAVLHRTSNQDFVSIVRGTGTGRFHPPTEYTVGEYVETIEDGDFDGDGDLDLVMTSGYAKTLYVLLNQGGGQFSTGTARTVPYSVFDVEVVDFNNDTKPDLVTRSDYIVMTLVGNGDGTFQPATEYTLDSPQVSVSSASINVARLDGNTTYDIVTTADGYYTVLLGNANGTFQALSSVAGYGATDSIAIGDFNGDATTDVVMGLSVLLGNGDGTFTPGGTIGGTFAGTFVGGAGNRAADLDGDGKLDLVAYVTKPGLHALHVLRGNANGTFAPPQIVALGRWGRSHAVGDFDEDGKLDVLVLQDFVHSSVAVLRGTGTGTLIGGSTFFGDNVGPGRAHFVPAAGDFDGNGTLDFFAMNDVTKNWGIQLAAADGTLTAMATQPIVSVDDVAFGDFNGDGDLDVLALGGGAHWLRGNGDGTLQAPSTSAMPAGWHISLQVAQLDSGTTADIAFVDPIDDTLIVAFGTGAGAWTGAATYPVADQPYAVAVADLDADGDRDLVVASRNGNAVTVFKNNGAGVFTGTPLASAGSPVSLAIGDVDGDGYVDIIAGEYTLETVGLFKGTGNGAFAAETRLSVGTITPRIELRDMDDDNDLDLVTTSAGLYISRGAAGATFLPPLLYDTGFWNGLVFDDFNGDSRPDIMAGQLDGAEPGFTIAYGGVCQ